MKHLTVKLHGEPVASVMGFDDDVDTHEFAPVASWIRHPRHAVLGQLWEARGAQHLVTHGLTPWFEHILPQAALRRAIAREVGVDEDDGLSLLAWLSDDLLGAVSAELAPGVAYLPPPKELAVADASAAYHCSLPGNQWKLSLSEGSNGYTLPARGDDSAWIAKLATGDFPRLVEVEAATMAWAAACGLDVPEVRVEPIARIGALPRDLPRTEGSAYLIRRFDRTPQGRVHTEDFGQILDTPPGPRQFASRYEYIAAVVAQLCPRDDLRAFVRQLVFCIVAGNADAHTKNWSLIYPDRRHPRLSPAYDLVSTVVYPDEKVESELALSLAGSKAMTPMTASRFHGIARVSGVTDSEVERWFWEDVTRTLAAWHTPTVKERYSARERARIERHIDACSLDEARRGLALPSG